MKLKNLAAIKIQTRARIMFSKAILANKRFERICEKLMKIRLRASVMLKKRYAIYRARIWRK